MEAKDGGPKIKDHLGANNPARDGLREPVAVGARRSSPDSTTPACLARWSSMRFFNTR
jgi:hypothetical protein